ncbi:MAG: hypothetical protein KF850_02815 [Labilithrix sp.]|nr:hypothetical protein [Labilithrix sp.]
MARFKIDPVLKATLEASKASNQPVEAVVVLAPSDTSSGVDSPAETTRKGKALLARVEHAVGRAPDSVNVFENLQSVAVRADARFIEMLLEQPEVDSAMANRAVASAPDSSRGRPRR